MGAEVLNINLSRVLFHLLYNDAKGVESKVGSEALALLYFQSLADV
jgi:hypothetical protein